MSVNRTFTANRDTRLVNAAGGSGNGQGAYIGSGPVTGVQTRSEINFPLDFSGGIIGVTSATLKLKVQDNVCGAIGASPGLFVELLTHDFTEGSYGSGSDCGYSTTNSEVWPGQSVSTANRAKYKPGSAPSAGDIITVDLTAMLEAARAAGKTKLQVRLIASDGSGYDESGGARTIHFHSVQGSYKPRIEVVLNDNHPPDKPTISAPVLVAGASSPTLVATAAGTQCPVSWAQNDQDAADTTQAVQFQVYAASATDAVPGAALVDKTVSYAGVTSGSYTLTGLQARTQLRLRVRTQDNKGAWGTWTSLADGFIQTAYQPNAPANPYFEVTNTNNPLVAGSISSSDPSDYVTAYDVDVLLDQVGGGSVSVYSTGGTGQAIGGAPTRAQININPQVTLNAGMTVRWRHRVYGRDGAVGTWSSYMNATLLSVTGPTGMTPKDRNTKLLTLTPQLTIADAANFDRYQYQIKRNGAVIYDSGVQTVGSTTSTNVNVPAGLLQWGDLITWNAAIRHTGNSSMDPMSPDYPLYVDTLPATTLAVSA